MAAQCFNGAKEKKRKKNNLLCFFFFLGVFGGLVGCDERNS